MSFLIFAEVCVQTLVVSVLFFEKSTLHRCLRIFAILSLLCRGANWIIVSRQEVVRATRSTLSLEHVSLGSLCGNRRNAEETPKHYHRASDQKDQSWDNSENGDSASLCLASRDQEILKSLIAIDSEMHTAFRHSIWWPYDSVETRCRFSWNHRL